jgi:hypothetical protein
MEVLRDVNLVGMSLLPLDACLFSWLIQKKVKRMAMGFIIKVESIDQNPIYEYIKLI